MPCKASAAGILGQALGRAVADGSATSSTSPQSAPLDTDAAARPGWPEGGVGRLVVGLPGGALVARVPADPLTIRLIFTALSAIAGLAEGWGRSVQHGPSRHRYDVRK